MVVTKFVVRILADIVLDPCLHVAHHLNLMDKIRSNAIQMILEFEFLIPKFQGLEYKGLGFVGLEPGGLDPIGLEFESLVLDPSVSDSRHGFGGSGPKTFLGFDLGRQTIGHIKG